MWVNKTHKYETENYIFFPVKTNHRRHNSIPWLNKESNLLSTTSLLSRWQVPAASLCLQNKSCTLINIHNEESQFKTKVNKYSKIDTWTVCNWYVVINMKWTVLSSELSLFMHIFMLTILKHYTSAYTWYTIYTYA